MKCESCGYESDDPDEFHDPTEFNGKIICGPCIEDAGIY